MPDLRHRGTQNNLGGVNAVTSTGCVKERRSALWVPRRALVGSLSALGLFAAGCWNLAGPPLLRDEGWTLTVARTMVEHGHYGRLMAGELAPPGLSAAFPLTASVALSFRLFGVGIWQGRMVHVLFMVGAIVVLYDLARRLYSRPVALGTLVVLLLLSVGRQNHPLTLGRQVLAEMPMLFFLLAGYTSFLLALRRSAWFLLLAIGLWGIGLMTKAQALPFWLASLFIPLVMTLLRRWWWYAALLGVGLLGSYIVLQRLIWLQALVLQGQSMDAPPLRGLYEVTAFVPVAFSRLLAVQTLLIVGLPALFGLCYASWQWVKHLGRPATDARLDIVRLAVLTLAGSWLVWYVSLSKGDMRYLAPATFIGSMFVASMLHDLTDRFSLRSTLGRVAGVFRRRRFDRRSWGALLAILMIVWFLPLAVMTLRQYYVTYSDTSALDVASFLNTHTPPDTLIETYDSELFFLLDRPYHYPPDQINIGLMRRMIRQDVPIDYDPLAADPDYLVVGHWPREWRLYDPVLATGAFRLLRQYGEYDIYERVR